MSCPDCHCNGCSPDCPGPGAFTVCRYCGSGAAIRGGTAQCNSCGAGYPSAGFDATDPEDDINRRFAGT
jgi:hypothetical protein